MTVRILHLFLWNYILNPFALVSTDVRLSILDFNPYFYPFRLCFIQIFISDDTNVHLEPILDNPTMVTALTKPKKRAPFYQYCLAYYCTYNSTADLFQSNIYFRLLVLKYNCLAQFTNVPPSPATVNDDYSLGVQHLLQFTDTGNIAYFELKMDPPPLAWYKRMRLASMSIGLGDSVRYTMHSYINFIFPPSLDEATVEALKGAALSMVGKFKTFAAFHKIYFHVPKKVSVQTILGLITTRWTLDKSFYYNVTISQNLTTEELDSQHLKSISLFRTGFRIVLHEDNPSINSTTGTPIRNYFGAYFKIGRFPSEWLNSSRTSSGTKMTLILFSIILSNYLDSTFGYKGTGALVAQVVLPTNQPKKTTSYYFLTHRVEYGFLACEENSISSLSFHGFLQPFEWELWAVLIFILISITLTATIVYPRKGMFANVIFMVFPYLLEQGMPFISKVTSKASFFWLFGPFLFLALIPTNCYKSIVTTDLTAPRHSARPETFKELTAANHSFYLSYDSEYAQELYACSTFIKFQNEMKHFFGKIWDWAVIDVHKCYEIAPFYIHFSNWVRGKINRTTSPEKSQFFSSLSVQIMGALPSGEAEAVLNCTKIVQILPSKTIRSKILELKLGENVNKSRLYQGKEKIGGVDQGIQITFLQEDGGMFKSRIRRVLESGIYNQWQTILEQYEVLRLMTGVNHDAKEPIPLSLSSSNIAALFYVFLCLVVVSFATGIMELFYVSLGELRHKLPPFKKSMYSLKLAARDTILELLFRINWGFNYSLFLVYDIVH